MGGIGFGAREERHDQHHGNHGDVLKDQDPQGGPPVGTFKLGPLLEELEYDGGAAERDEKSHEEGFVEGSPCQAAHEEYRQCGQENLARTAHDDQAFDGEEALQGKFHADGEQQEHDADFRENLHFVKGADEAESVGSRQYSRDEKSHDGMDPEAVAQEDHGDGKDENDQDLVQ